MSDFPLGFVAWYGCRCEVSCAWTSAAAVESAATLTPPTGCMLICAMHSKKKKTRTAPHIRNPTARLLVSDLGPSRLLGEGLGGVLRWLLQGCLFVIPTGRSWAVDPALARARCLKNPQRNPQRANQMRLLSANVICMMTLRPRRRSDAGTHHSRHGATCLAACV